MGQLTVATVLAIASGQGVTAWEVHQLCAAWLGEHGIETPEFRAPMQASEARGDWVMVPREPTEEMLEAGRSAVMARDCSGPKWGPADHYRAAGIDRTGIPDRLFEGRQKMSKAWGAELVYAAMISAHTQAGPVG